MKKFERFIVAFRHWIELNKARLRLWWLLLHHPKTMFGISGWRQLGGNGPGGQHGHNCTCWSCQSQANEP